MTVLYIDSRYITRWAEFSSIALGNLTLCNRRSIQIQNEILSAYRDGVLYNWAIDLNLTNASELDPLHGYNLSDKLLKERIASICGKRDYVADTLIYEEYIQHSEDMYIKDLKGGKSLIPSKEIIADFNDKIVAISISFKVLKFANDFIEATISQVDKDNQIIIKNSVNISLKEKGFVSYDFPVVFNDKTVKIQIKANTSVIADFYIPCSLNGGLVDMGTSVLWSKRNLGALKEYDDGLFFSWGNMEDADYFSKESWTYKQVVCDDISLGTEYDVVRKRLGKGYRIPNYKDWEELLNCCKISQVEIRNRKFLKLLSKKTKQMLILPMAGVIEGSDRDIDMACYWSGTQYSGKSAYILASEWNKTGISRLRYEAKWKGLPIRPVCDRMLGYETTQTSPEERYNDISLSNVFSRMLKDCVKYNARVFENDMVTIEGFDLDKLNNKLRKINPSSIITYTQICMGMTYKELKEYVVATINGAVK